MTMNSENQKGQARVRLVVNNERDSDGGYMSGRSSCLETPEMASTDSTRSAGTRPDLRHFCTAWYRTPHFAANGCNPPPPEIARSTTLMKRILQPIVATSQQPMRANRPGSMQLVIVKTKDEARAEFSRNLNKELERYGAPKRGRAEWLRKELGGVVSREAARKWLKAKDLPDEAHMSILIDRFGLNVQHLRTGRWEPSPGSKDVRFVELERAWPNLDENSRNAIMGVLHAVKPPEAEKTARPKRRQN